jgi:hypothetical protein
VSLVVFAPPGIAGPTPDFSPPPGVLNPQVTQADNSLKRKQMAERHLPGTPADYQEDHLVAIELGGHPRDPRNLWPEPIAQAHIKDAWELTLNRAVCAGRMTVTTAQPKIKDPSTWK